jgi:hypothetical protein
MWRVRVHPGRAAAIAILGLVLAEIPGDLDITGFRTVVIWCRRFAVGFGVAPI